MRPLIFPLLIGIAAATASLYWGWAPQLNDQAAVLGFAGSVASIAATMLGFMLATLAILSSISNSRLVRMMRKTGHYTDLLRTIFWGCVIFLVVGLGGYALLFGAPARPAFLSALLGLHVASLVSLMSIGRKFWLVLSNLKPDGE